jgi:type IV pilus assembly protein PilE
MNTFPTKRSRNKTEGFTLIEMMIVVAVIGILAAIAYPNYIEQVNKGRRANARAVLSEAQQYMERIYSENYSYYSDTSGTLINSASYFQSNFSKAPKPGEGNAIYNITLTVAQTTPNQYTLTATRITTGPMANDYCGDYRVTHTGRKGVLNYNTTRFTTPLIAARECWR